MPPHCRAENRGDRRGGVQRTVHASNCGVSQVPVCACVRSCVHVVCVGVHAHVCEGQKEADISALALATHTGLLKCTNTHIYGCDKAYTYITHTDTHRHTHTIRLDRPACTLYNIVS
jgi:hypothetical protein